MPSSPLSSHPWHWLEISSTSFFEDASGESSEAPNSSLALQTASSGLPGRAERPARFLNSSFGNATTAGPVPGNPRADFGHPSLEKCAARNPTLQTVGAGGIAQAGRPAEHEYQRTIMRWITCCLTDERMRLPVWKHAENTKRRSRVPLPLRSSAWHARSCTLSRYARRRWVRVIWNFVAQPPSAVALRWITAGGGCATHARNHPHPNLLPEYREKGRAQTRRF